MIEITDSAADILKDMIEANGDKGSILRLFVAGMGCSGAQYGLAFDKETTSEDEVMDVKGISVAIKKDEIESLINAKVDYVKSECGAGFTITVPTADGGSCRSSCGGGCS